MQFDLGLEGPALLVGISLAFGKIAQAIFRSSATRRLWLIGGTARFSGGLFASEVVWGSLTGEEIQPIVDGLARDESLLGASSSASRSFS